MSRTVNGYFDDLASSRPTPGGGSAAMVCASLSCALVAMVARICHNHELAGRADSLRARMDEMRQRDEAAYQRVVDAKGDKAAVQLALHNAAAVPLESAAACLDALQLADDALALNNPHLISDVGCANEFARAALRACAYNVRVNHKYMKDKEAAAQQRARLEEIERAGESLFERIAVSVDASLRTS